MKRTLILTSLLSLNACVDVPEQSRIAFEYDGPDAATAWALQLDAGAMRPPQAPPYNGPECDPAPSGAEGAGEAEAAFAQGGEGERAQPVGAAAGGAGAAAPDGGVRGMEEGAAAGDAPPPPAHPAQPGEVLITEWMADPDALPDGEGEWIELYNASASSFDLGGCSLLDGDSEKPLPSPLRLEAGRHLVLARSAAVAFAPAAVVRFTLNNDGDRIGLACDGVLIDQVSYDATFPRAAGASISLSGDAYDAMHNDRAASYCLGRVVFAGDRGTPGERNPVCSALDADADAGAP